MPCEPRPPILSSGRARYGVKGSGENADKDGEVPASLVEASLPDEHKEHYNNYMDQAHNAYADYMEKYDLTADISGELSRFRTRGSIRIPKLLYFKSSAARCSDSWQ